MLASLDEIANDCHLNITDTSIKETHINYNFLQDKENKIGGEMWHRKRKQIISSLSP
jgi:hypothetical protein